MEQDDLAAWLARWLRRRSPAIVLLSPAGKRLSADKDWTPAEASIVPKLAQDACARALERVGARFA